MSATDPFAAQRIAELLPPELSELEAAFVAAYLTCFDTAQAMALVEGDPGRENKRYSARKKMGDEILARDNVRQALANGMMGRVEKLNINLENLILELGRIAFSDIRELFAYDEDGNPVFRPLDQIPTHAARAIKEIRITKTIGREGQPAAFSTTIKQYDKMAAIQLLAQMMGFAQKVDVNVSGQITMEAKETKVAEVMARLAKLAGRTLTDLPEDVKPDVEYKLAPKKQP